MRLCKQKKLRFQDCVHAFTYSDLPEQLFTNPINLQHTTHLCDPYNNNPSPQSYSRWTNATLVQYIRFLPHYLNRKQSLGARHSPTYADVIIMWRFSGSKERISISWCIPPGGSPRRIRFPRRWCRLGSSGRLFLLPINGGENYTLRQVLLDYTMFFKQFL